MKLIWYQRRDGRWNADCACGACCVGVPFEERAEMETWHFEKTGKEREDYRALARSYKREIAACGPKMPEEDINNYFEHWIFA